MKRSISLILVLVAILLAPGCVTEKKKGSDVSRFKRGYHNLTSRYNYWFNADELFTLTQVELESQHRDNYNQILDLYPYAAVDPQSARGNLDNVITKAARGIALHRPSDWVDDCYTLIGQSQYLKRDFETAENTFRYIKEEHDPRKVKPKPKLKKSAKQKKKEAKQKKKEKEKKKKKKKKAAKKKKKAAAKKKGSDKGKTLSDKNQPKAQEVAQTEDDSKKKKKEEPPKPTGVNPYEKGMGRTAAYPLAMIWFGRTLTEREKYDEADFLYRELWEDMWFPAHLRDELATAEAYLWIKQKKYDRAIAPLTKAVELTNKRKERARLAYILAQLQLRAGNNEQAYAAFNKVMESKPKYEMLFNANLRLIQSGWSYKKITSEEANNSLSKMLKDEKNREYNDQIYFVMADIALQDGKRDDAIAYLRKSLDHNQNNAPQRAEAYLKLAELYFENEDFVQAKLYFDSTLTVLPANDPRYKNASDYAVNLKDIARLIQAIAANDSIVRVYSMNDEERRALARQIKKQREEESRLADEKAKQALASGGAKAPTPQAGGRASTFYFYNDAFLKKGKKDFSKTWGNRNLEDNWRRSRRPTISLIEDSGRPDGAASAGVSDAELQDLFASLPKSEAELSVIHLATYEAMYQLGTLFRDKIQNNKRCSSTLEEKLSRYPDQDKYEKETWYYCYLAFTDLSNRERAKYYLDKLAAKYPNSAYARAITDPNFLNATKARERELNNYYEETFTAFQKGEYKNAYDRCQEAPQKYGSQNPLMAKFSLLSALCIGNLQGTEAYCKALSEVIARHPETAEATRAKEISRLISCKGFEVAAAEDPKKRPDQPPLDDAFTLEDDKLHYFLVAINGSDIRLDEVKNAVSDYNRENHRLEQLRISNIFLGNDTDNPIIVIRKFDTKEQAMRYYQEVSKKLDFLGETDKKKYNKEFFAITQENYRRILKNRTLNGYREFFNENYLK
ncbi:MAG: tetratricopeptide repeat protein [Saprospiraceae bacterium]|nr:tetratricopeptide repeat protein [Saprospiraceae bacterium]